MNTSSCEICQSFACLYNLNHLIFLLQQKEKDRQKSAARKLMSPKDQPSKSQKKSTTGDNRGEFDDLISALRTGDVFGDEMSKIKGRRRTAGPKPTRKPQTKSDRERIG